MCVCVCVCTVYIYIYTHTQFELKQNLTSAVSSGSQPLPNSRNVCTAHCVRIGLGSLSPVDGQVRQRRD